MKKASTQSAFFLALGFVLIYGVGCPDKAGDKPSVSGRATVDLGSPRIESVAFIPGIEKRPGYHAVSGVALSPDGSKLYAAHWQAGTVRTNDPIPVDSTAGLSLLGEIPGGGCVGGVAVSGDGRYVCAPTYYGGRVSQYDTSNRAAKTTVRLGSWANMVWLRPDGARLIVNYRASSGRPSVSHWLALMDTSGDNFAKIGTLNMGRPIPQAKAAFSGDLTRMYVGAVSSTTEGPALLEVSLADTFQVTRKVVLADGANQPQGGVSVVAISGLQ
jgi:DNA-binding beta-propeller fold protein YncE